MRLHAVGPHEFGEAGALLSEGFPRIAEKDWRESLDRILSHSVPFNGGTAGYIAQVRGENVGICLTVPRWRTAFEMTPRLEISLCSFFLRPGHEWMTTVFLRKMMAKTPAVYVDITATRSISEINRHLDFVDHSRGVTLIPTPLAAFRPGFGGRLLAWSEAPADCLPASMQTIMADHEQLGCLCLVVRQSDAFHPMIVAPTSHGMAPGARVILAPSRSLINSVLGPLSRRLLKLGAIFLEYDGPSPSRIAESWFLKNASPVQRTVAVEAVEPIDLSYSELAFIHKTYAPKLNPMPRRPRTAVQQAR